MESTKQQLEVERSLLIPELQALEDFLKESPVNVVEVRIQYNFVLDCLGSFHRVLNNYYALLLEHKKNDEYKREKEEEAKLLKRKTRLEFQCSPYLTNTSGSGSGDSGGGRAEGGNSHEQYRMKLPRRELPRFDGDVRNWSSFWAAFEEIHLDKNMPDAEKFQYLLQSTTIDSPARKVVKSFPMSAANYQLAVESLKENFGRDTMVIKVYIRDLLKLVVDNAKEKPTLKFTDLVTLLNGQLRNLEALGVTKDDCGKILYPVIESCVPSSVLREWMKSREYDEDVDALMTFLRNEVRREIETSLAHSPFLSTPKDSGKAENKKQVNSSDKQHKKDKKEIPTVSSFLADGESKQEGCVFCSGQHSSGECTKATSFTFEERKEKLFKAGHCVRCLKKGHFVKKCRSQLKCLCGGKHHILACAKLAGWSSKESSTGAAEKDDGNAEIPQKEQSEKVTTLHNGVNSPMVPLLTLRLKAYGPSGKIKEIRAIIDPGSQRSYVKKELADYLELKQIGQESCSHQLFGGVITPTEKYTTMMLMVSDLQGNDKCQFELSAKRTIASLPALPIKGTWVKDFASRGITFTDLHSSSSDIQLLIGNKLSHQVLTGKKCSLPNGLGALQTRWGWVLSGEIPDSSCSTVTSMMVTNLHVADHPLSDLWALETIGILDSATTQSRKELEDATQKHFEETVRRQADGRYEVQLPFLVGCKDVLPSNRKIAERRLQNATKQLKKNGFYEAYNKMFEQWQEEGMIEEVDDDYTGPNEVQVHYLPHHPVIKLNNTTTPIRPVFDASCKERGKKSLNDSLERGPNTLELIPSLLTRFRLNAVGVISDIKKAFQQISVHPTHRDFLRFLWWEDDTCKKLKTFRHNRVVFGVSSSPFLLGATLQFHFKLENKGQETTAKQLQNSLYVDNCVISLNDYVAAYKFKEDSMKLLSPAKFELRDWAMGPVQQESQHSVLGLIWDAHRDQLTYDLKAVLPKLGGCGTQRKLLSLVHTLFDPLGWLSPFLLQAKLILRKSQSLKLGWDREFGEELEEDFQKWLKQIPKVGEYLLPRYVQWDSSSSRSLHVFCDASNYAYAAVIFLRVLVDGRVKVYLLEAKSRVSPMKNITIPRLELLSCLIAARMAFTMKKTLQSEEIPTVFWSDSSTALAWIIGNGQWATFVHNRVEEIRMLTEGQQWRHIPGKLNPADVPSRGCSINKLLESKWYEGPEWLYAEEENWPISNVQPKEEEVKSELKKTVVSLVAPVSSEPHFIERFNFYDKALRVVAYVIRFISKLKKQPVVMVIPPTADEIEKAEILMIKKTQEFSVDNKKVMKLKPYQDENGIWRIVSRLTHSDDELFKQPILLPEYNHFVKLLIKREHLMLKHAGVQVVLASLREKFWIVNGRRTVRKVVVSCIVCRRYLSKKLEVPEAPLPSLRTATAAPFSTTGMDMAGPLTLRGGEKVWIAIFTCAVYRGIHLELTHTLTTDEFLEMFRRFVSRRGRPQTVYSDNGLNFVGASRIFLKLDWSKVQEYAAVNRMSWRFNPPNAAWWGGWWERLIGLVKQLLVRNLGKRAVHERELITLLCEIESILNSRPLTYQSEDPRDPYPLTPNHFIRNAALSFLPEVDVKDATGIRKAYKKLQNLREDLRHRFRKEYLGQLVHQSANKRRELKTGDVVLVEFDNVKRVEWPLGVVEEVIKGKDGVSRTYRVRTKGGVELRAAQRLFPFEIQE